ncbi:uncharacterized protein LOC114711616 [Neltuma alba]|uniref:uncharacterized protein LOC114711616 n=1 Tax=Neltuma alba TaxID=207710 RepID=UPI0010A375B2|nr:uncharacterized protein LOC114711616 [Prosopis alba]
MITNSGGAIAMAIPRRPLCRPICCASSIINTEHLRSQLDQLHAEAETTRAKANNARLRLLRLSEAAEKLQKQAAVSVQKGKENDAREILFQRKKVLQALEKSKTRIELLDELFTKLCEAISLKESQLIGHVSLNIEGKTEDSSSPVRIISPKEECGKDITDNDLDFNVMKSVDIQDVQISAESQGDSLSDKETGDLQQSINSACLDEDKKASVLTEIASYEALMGHIDQKLSEIEVELITTLKASNLLLDGDEKPKNSRWQQMVELLESIHGIRQRIRSIGSQS